MSGVINSYYPGSGTAGAGSTSITVGAVDTTSGGQSIAIGVGDLLLVIQMQDADISSSNSSSYGGSLPGTGYTFLNNSGVYEYAIATNAISTGGGTISIASPLQNTYRNADYSGVSGQRRFQVLRVPQYSSATLNGVISSTWNGKTGGVVAADVAGQLNLNGSTINVSGKGFRGGAGVCLSGVGGTKSICLGNGGSSSNGYACTDYMTTAPSNGTNNKTTAATGTNASKGEGIAGTPRYVFHMPNGFSSGSAIDNVVEGYPGGSFSRGAPGNAGGGGTDGNTFANDENTGGGGGGGYSNGGLGGYGWVSGNPPGPPVGGYGGYAVPLAPGRLTMGGGGGAGTTNNCTGGMGAWSSSGTAGGGIVIIRAATITGTGTINANGADYPFAYNDTANDTLNDASGGAGAGGSILVFASGNNGSVGSLTVSAKGGSGGNNTPGGTSGCPSNCTHPHGPGGGGSGGFVALSSAPATIDVSGGANGITNSSLYTTSEYGSTASSGGYQVYSVVSTDTPGATSNSLCYPKLTVTKTTGKANTVQGSDSNYAITVSNATGLGTALNTSISDSLPGLPNPNGLFTYLKTDSVLLSGGATRTALPPATNPAANSTTPAWSGFTIPGGGKVVLNFTVNVPASTSTGTYQNPATVTYSDPTRTSGADTVTPGGTYKVGGTVAGSNYAATSTTLEDVTIRLAAAPLVKSFNPTSINAGGTSVMTISVTNPNAIILTNAALTDTYPAGLTNTSAPAGTITGTGCSGTITAAANAGSLALSNGTIPANGTCTITVNVTAATAASYTNTLPVAAFTNDYNVINTAAVSATLYASPSISKAFSPLAVAPNTDSTMSFTITNPNLGQALSGVNFTDNFPSGLIATGGTVTGSGCGSFSPSSLVAGATAFNFTNGSITAGGTCTLSLAVRSGTQGIYLNTTGGVGSTQTAVGQPSNTAPLGVGVIGIAKSFSPARIASGGTSTITFNLTNPTGVAQTNGSFSDTLANMAIAGTAIGGTCTGVTPSSLSIGQTALNFTGINVPATSCTITATVTSSNVGSNPNIAGGVTTASLPKGPDSSAAILTVTAPPSISKSFNPSVIQLGSTSTMTFNLLNGDSIPLTNASFTDTLTGMSIATSGTAGGTCTGASSNNFTAGATSLSFSGITIPTGNAGCTVTVPVTSSTISFASGYANTTSGVSSNEAATSPASNTANLIVVNAPSITKAFGTSPIGAGNPSTLTFTLSNIGTSNIALTNATFTDTLSNMEIKTAGAAGGTCVGASSNSFTAGQTGILTFTGITIPANNSCTVTVNVTSYNVGTNPNTSSGVTTAQTPIAGAVSNTANLVVLNPPLITESFNKDSIQVGGTSVKTFTLSNPNSTALTNVSFTDTLANMQINAAGAANGTCTGASGNSFTAGQTNLSFSGITVSANSSCTVTVVVISNAISPAGGHPNTASGASSNETPLAGPTPSPAYLQVIGPPTITKSFSPAAIGTGGTSTITFTLTNPNAISLTGGNLTDTFPTSPGAMKLTNAAQNYVGSGRGTCSGLIPNGNAAGNQATSLNIAGIVIPANSSCTILVDVTAPSSGTYSNTATISTFQSASATSNPATLAVALLGINKAFSTNTLAVNTNATLTFTLTNPTGSQQTGANFTDTYPTGLVNASPLTVGGTCASITHSATVGGGSFNLTGATVPANGSCTVTVLVTSATAGSYSNTTSGLASTQTTTRGPASNTATVQFVAKPTIAKAFNSSTIGVGGRSAMTFTLTNSNSIGLTNANFTDTLTGFSVASPTLGGTCSSVSSSPALAAGATSLNLTIPTLLANSGCTITVQVTTNTAGTYNNTSSGVTTAQTSVGTASNTATLTATGTTLTKTFSPSTIAQNGSSTVTFTITNGTGNPAQSGLAFVETLPGNVTLAAPVTVSQCGGTVSSTGANNITFNGGSLSAGTGSCTITALVTSAAPGTYNNTNSNISGLSTGLTANVNTSLTVLVPPTISKVFSPASVQTNTNSTLTLTLSNSNSVAANGVAFTDNYPANLINATPANLVNNCGGTATAAAGTGSVGLTGGTIPANGSCSISVVVNSVVGGTYVNTSSAVSSTNTGTSTTTATNTLVVTSPVSLTLSKISYGNTGSFSFTGNNGFLNQTVSTIANGVAATGTSQILASPNTQTTVTETLPSPTANWTLNSVSCTDNNAAITGNAGTFGSLAGNTLTIPAGNVVAGADIRCTFINSFVYAYDHGDAPAGFGDAQHVVPGTPTVYLGIVAPDTESNALNSNNADGDDTAGTADEGVAQLQASGAASFPALLTTDTSYTLNLRCAGTGTVSGWIDFNKNNAFDSGERAQGSCGGGNVSLNWTGLAGLTSGNTYARFRIASNASEVANATGSATDGEVEDYVFAIGSGGSITGKVFLDSGTSSGIANNGIQDGGELGLFGATVKLTNCGATVYASTITKGAGQYSLSTQGVAAGTVCVEEVNPAAYTSTGANTSTGTVTNADKITFNLTANTNYTNLNFGDVLNPRFFTDGQKNGLAGTTVLYAHSFIAGTAGNVTFTVSNAVSSPNLPGWSETLFRDSNCDGVLNGTEANTQLSSSISATEGDTVCLIVREFIPATAPQGASNLVTIKASFAYLNSSLPNADLTHQDVTTVSDVALTILKEVRNVTKDGPTPVWKTNNNAKSGETLEYRLTYTNTGTTAISNLSISDTTPAFTTYVSGLCETAIGATPTDLGTCTLGTKPAVGGVGALKWTFSKPSGTPQLPAGGTGYVTYQVKLN